MGPLGCMRRMRPMGSAGRMWPLESYGAYGGPMGLMGKWVLMKFMRLRWAAQSAVDSMKKPTQPTHGPIVSGQLHEGTDSACTYVRKSIFFGQIFGSYVIIMEQRISHMSRKSRSRRRGRWITIAKACKYMPWLGRCFKECRDLRAGTDVNGNTYVVMLLIENRNCLKHVMKHIMIKSF